MAFHQYSKEIVTEYLGTVAYVDDLIFREKIQEAEPKKIKTPTRETVVDSSKSKEDSKVVIQEAKRNINPQKFTEAFIQKGIHCSLFEIENDDDPLDAIKRTLKRSDVIILDWQMHFDNGKKAKELLFSVVNSSKSTELRLIIIFTNDPNYNKLLSESIIPELEKIGIQGNSKKNNDCIYNFGHSKIVVLEKSNGKQTETTLADEDLPDRIIQEFAEITEGLVSNTALKAISVIRRNTHNLLAKFNRNLDAALLNHRAFLDKPSESELHLISWLSDEIKDMLFHNKVSNETRIENIKIALEEREQKDYHIFDKDGKENKKISIEDMLNLLSQGCAAYNIENNNNGKNVPSKWFKHFYKSFSEEDKFINEKFAVLSSLSSYSFTHDAHQLLTLGVVVEYDSEVLICIQPSCDSVRLTENTRFVFLKTEMSDDKFEIVIPIQSQFKKLRIIYKPESIKLVTFIPTNETVTSKTIASQEIFENIIGQKYKWLGNLKYPFAQRISSNFAHELSRVGLDESEWLRRSKNA